MSSYSVPPLTVLSSADQSPRKGNHSICVWMPHTTPLPCTRNCSPGITTLMFAVGVKRNERKKSLLAIALVDGWWNAAMLGSIALVASWFAGRRRWRIIWPSFIWLALNLSSPRFWFSDKLLMCLRCGPKRYIAPRRITSPPLVIKNHYRYTTNYVTARNHISKHLSPVNITRNIDHRHIYSPVY